MALSTATCASFDLTEYAYTTIYIVSDNSSYTHTLQYIINGTTGTIATKTSQKTVIWSPSLDTMYALIPNTISASARLRCYTYDGDTLLGTKTTYFYMRADSSICTPTVTGSVVDTNNLTIAATGDSSKLVRFASKPKVTMNVDTKYSATLSSQRIEHGGYVETTSPVTYNETYSNNFYLTATDSRGYVGNATVQPTDYIEYDPPYFTSTKILRLESTSTTGTLTLAGRCFKGNFGVMDNMLYVEYKVKTEGGSYGRRISLPVVWEDDGTFTVNASINNLSLANNYVFQFYIVDRFSEFVSDEIVLGQGIGDFRIAQNYVASKNNIIVGSSVETGFKSFRARRKIDNVDHFSEYGVSNISGMAGLILQLYKSVSGSNERLARYDIREDGFMYNYHTNMSVAEMMSSAPTMATNHNQGSILLNAGDSTPILGQWGRVNQVPAGANVVTSIPINFLQPFSSQPVVFVGSVHNLSVNLDVGNGAASNTGVTLYIKRPNTGNTGLFWIAVGNGTAALPV